MCISGCGKKTRLDPAGVRDRWRRSRLRVDTNAGVVGRGLKGSGVGDVLVLGPICVAVMGEAGGKREKGRRGGTGGGCEAFGFLPMFEDLGADLLLGGT